MPRFALALALSAVVVPIVGYRVVAADAIVAPEPVEVSLTPVVTVIAARPEQHLAIDEALARFRSAGLELPDVEIRYLADDAGCGGHLGLFQRDFTPWRVLVCSDLPFVPTHELAHAWEAANLDDHERARYVEARGIPTWNDRDADWNERGIEDAAFIIQQNLMARHPNLDSPTWRERTAAYELLTGASSPLGGSDPSSTAVPALLATPQL